MGRVQGGKNITNNNANNHSDGGRGWQVLGGDSWALWVHGRPGLFRARLVKGCTVELGALELGRAGYFSSLTPKSFGSLLYRKETESQRGTVSC